MQTTQRRNNHQVLIVSEEQVHIKVRFPTTFLDHLKVEFNQAERNGRARDNSRGGGGSPKRRNHCGTQHNRVNGGDDKT